MKITFDRLLSTVTIEMYSGGARKSMSVTRQISALRLPAMVAKAAFAARQTVPRIDGRNLNQ